MLGLGILPANNRDVSHEGLRNPEALRRNCFCGCKDASNLAGAEAMAWHQINKPDFDCTHASMVKPAVQQGNVVASELTLPERLEDDKFVDQRKIMHLLSNRYDNGDALENVRFAHAIAIEHGLHLDVPISNSLITMYGRHGDICDACIIFEQSHVRTVVSWTAMINAFCHQNQHNEALRLFHQLQQQENVQPNEITFTTVLRSCAAIEALRDGQLIHACIVQNGHDHDVFTGTALIDMYGKCSALEDARFVFDRMPTRNLATWNSIITAYAQQNCGEDAFEVFRIMITEGVRPDRITFISLLNACASLKDASLRDGYIIHSFMVQDEIEKDVIVSTCLVDMYGNCNALEDAWSTFTGMPERTAVSWNAMIRACDNQGKYEKALQLFAEMQREGIMPDAVTFVNVIHACAISGGRILGRQIHASILSIISPVLETALVHMYGKMGDLDDAQSVFDCMHEHDLVCWTAIINAYAEEGKYSSALHLFQLLKKTGLKPDLVTFISVLTVCADFTVLDEGRSIYASIVECGLESQLSVANALLNMYGKCGSLEDARTVFERRDNRNLVTWNSMIAAYSQQGHAKEALKLFQHMQKEKIAPDQVTFVSVLVAYTHEGLLQEGIDCFAAMIADFHILPGLEHYSCIIDLFGRFGKLDEAEDIIFSMPVVPDAQAWITFLGACKMHGDRIRGSFVAKYIMNLEPLSAIPYISLSNIFAEFENEDLIRYSCRSD